MVNNLLFDVLDKTDDFHISFDTLISMKNTKDSYNMWYNNVTHYSTICSITEVNEVYETMLNYTEQ